MGGPIPDRWLHCPPTSEIIADRFIAFKTPLSSVYNKQIPEDCRFDVPTVFYTVEGYEVKLGLWIDLTNTNRYYRRDDVMYHNCKYIKLRCQGYGGAPDRMQTRKFINICQEFIYKNPDDLIGVHCTHGFNRTGFLISCFMIENMRCSAETAISHFGEMRYPGIYKGEYLRELYARYDDVRYAPSPPDLPDWCVEGGESGKSKKKNKKKKKRKRQISTPTQ